MEWALLVLVIYIVVRTVRKDRADGRDLLGGWKKEGKRPGTPPKKLL